MCNQFLNFLLCRGSSSDSSEVTHEVNRSTGTGTATMSSNKDSPIQTKITPIPSDHKPLPLKPRNPVEKLPEHNHVHNNSCARTQQPSDNKYSNESNIIQQKPKAKSTWLSYEEPTINIFTGNVHQKPSNKFDSHSVAPEDLKKDELPSFTIRTPPRNEKPVGNKEDYCVELPNFTMSTPPTRNEKPVEKKDHHRVERNYDDEKLNYPLYN